MQLGVRQARYFGRAKTLFQLLIGATVANLTLVAVRTGLVRDRNHPQTNISIHVYALFVVRHVSATLSLRSKPGFSATLLDELRGILDQLRRAAEESDQVLFNRLDFSFHERLCLLSGSGRLHRVFLSFAGVLNMLFRLEVERMHLS